MSDRVVKNFLSLIILMTTLPPFRLSVTSAGSAESVGPTPLGGHVVLDFSGTYDKSGSDRGSFDSDRESGEFNQLWTSLAEFDRWRQEQRQLYSIEFLLAHTRPGVHYIWKRTYKCGREGTGGEKHYQKKHDQIRKIGTKRTGCTCQIIVKAYPDRDTLLGKYIEDHDHPIGIKNLIYTRVSDDAKGKAREMLQCGVEPRKVVCNHRFRS